MRTKIRDAVDVHSKRTRVVETDDQGTTSSFDWVYDNLGRLVQENYDHGDDGQSSRDYTATYDFDLVGNRLEKTLDNSSDSTVDETETSFYDRNDRLLREEKDAASDTTTFYGYDATKQTNKNTYGGLIQTEPGSGTTNTTTFTYNVQGRLAKVEINEDGTGPVEKTTEYEYNGSGARVKQTVTETGIAPVVTEYHIDPNNPTGYAKAIEEIVDGVLDKSYVLGHAIISQTLAAGDVHHFLLDGHNSTRALLTAATTVLESYAYDAYGKTITGTGLGLTAADDAQTTWLYGGDGQYDQATQLVNHLARWRSGHRFLSLDPFGGNFEDPQSLHKYLYAHADPVNGVDFTGNAVGKVGKFSVQALDEALVTLQLAEAAYVGSQSAFPKGWRPEGIKYLPSIGFRAAAFKNPSKKEIIVAFAGTDDLKDWSNGNVPQATGIFAKQYAEAAKYAGLIKARLQPGWTLKFTGHSLGGGLASLAAGAHRVPAITFNPAALHRDTPKMFGTSKQQVLRFVTSYHVQGEILSKAEGLFGFNSLYGIPYALPAQPGKGALDLHSVEAVAWGLNDLRNTALGGGSILSRIKGYNRANQQRIIDEWFRSGL